MLHGGSYKRYHFTVVLVCYTKLIKVSLMPTSDISVGYIYTIYLYMSMKLQGYNS